jgi:hypothetical protein
VAPSLFFIVFFFEKRHPTFLCGLTSFFSHGASSFQQHALDASTVIEAVGAGKKEISVIKSLSLLAIHEEHLQH